MIFGEPVMLELFADNLDLVHKVIKSHRLRQNKSIMIFIIIRDITQIQNS